MASKDTPAGVQWSSQNMQQSSSSFSFSSSSSFHSTLAASPSKVPLTVKEVLLPQCAGLQAECL